MLFNNRKPEEPIARGTTLSPEPREFAAAASPARVQARATMAGAPARCVIDASLVITGKLESERDVQLDGELHGDIHCQHLIISRDATLLGHIVANDVVVRGKVKGIIRADQVMLQDTARVESEIFHKSLIVEQGACFDGESHRSDEPARADTDLQPHVDKLQAMAADMKATETGGAGPGESESAAA